MRQKHLCEVFSMTQGCFSYYLDIGLFCLHKSLLTVPTAIIELPHGDRIESFRSLIRVSSIVGMSVLEMLTTMEGSAESMECQHSC